MNMACILIKASQLRLKRSHIAHPLLKIHISLPARLSMEPGMRDWLLGKVFSADVYVCGDHDPNNISEMSEYISCSPWHGFTMTTNFDLQEPATA
jgi:hypothetical protein